MGNDSLIASTTQFQTLLIALVLIVAVIYFFIELRRVDSRISSLETSIKNLNNDKEIQMNNIRNQPNIVESNVESNVIKHDLEPNVEQDLENDVEQGINDELNDYVENQLNYEVTDNINEEINEGINEGINEEVEEVISNGKKEELEINKESIGIAGLSILSYMPMINKSDDIKDSSNNIEEMGSEESYVEESTIEELDVEESSIQELEVSESSFGELDITEPIEENSSTNQEYIKDMTIKELKNVLNDMELPTSGNKTKLIQRIVSNQK